MPVYLVLILLVPVTKTWTFTYTDCAGVTYPWVYTYTISAPVVTMPAGGASTVACAGMQRLRLRLRL